MSDKQHTRVSPEGSVTWKSPSNIALIKYWGKYEGQIPANPSLSMTLKNAHTVTNLQYRKTADPGRIIKDFKLKNAEGSNFKDRVEKYFSELSKSLPEIPDYEFLIESENTFPHSAGIASSASAFSALALCILTWQENIRKEKYSIELFHSKASDYARRGSGSASRSVYGDYALWGASDDIEGSSNDHAIALNEVINPVFRNMKDTILVVNAREKKVSSSRGHQTMNGHAFASSRYRQARENLREIIKAMKTGQWEVFSAITENEALTLHALMMSARKGFILMDQNTLKVIEELKIFREQRQIKICFTLDAGPNVHLLYPASEEPRVRPFIREELSKYCKEGFILEDETGEGPVLVKNEIR